jgi:hypothetical protein
MRVLSAIVLGCVIGVTGCGALSGLGDYGESAGNGDPALSHEGGTGSSVDTDAGLASSDDTADPSADAAEDGSAPSDPDGDTTPILDASAYADVDFDAPPPCGPMTCGGCCMNGTCVGGASVDTCGVGGNLCTDCSSKGGACSKGACATPVVDAAPPPACKSTSCGGCIPFYQSGCCKSDNTCGCVVSFSGGTCK